MCLRFRATSLSLDRVGLRLRHLRARIMIVIRRFALCEAFGASALISDFGERGHDLIAIEIRLVQLRN